MFKLWMHTNSKSIKIAQIFARLYGSKFSFHLYFNLLQDEYLDEEQMMMDRSPDETESNDGELDELDSDNDLGDDMMNTTSDGERIIYPWMKKIHVAGVGEYYLWNYQIVML